MPSSSEVRHSNFTHSNNLNLLEPEPVLKTYIILIHGQLCFISMFVNLSESPQLLIVISDFGTLSVHVTVDVAVVW